MITTTKEPIKQIKLDITDASPLGFSANLTTKNIASDEETYAYLLGWVDKNRAKHEQMIADERRAYIKSLPWYKRVFHIFRK